VFKKRKSPGAEEEQMKEEEKILWDPFFLFD